MRRSRLISISIAIASLQSIQCAADAQMYYNQDAPGGFAGRAGDNNFSNGFTTQNYAPGQPVQQSYYQPAQPQYSQQAQTSFNTAASLENMLNRVDTNNSWAPSQMQQYPQQQYQAQPQYQPQQQYRQPQQFQQQQYRQPQQMAMQRPIYTSAPAQFHSYMHPQSIPNVPQQYSRNGGGPVMNTWQRIFPNLSKQDMLRVFLEGGTPDMPGSGGYQGSASSGQSSANASQARSTAYSNYQTAANEETKSRNCANTAHYDKDKWNRKNAADRAYYAANNANYAAERAEAAANSSGDSQARGYANSARACANRARYNANQARYNADTIQ